MRTRRARSALRLRARGRTGAGVTGPVVTGVALFLLGVVVTAGSVTARSAAAQARDAVTVNEILQRAALAVAAEESLERKYLLEPGPAPRSAHEAAERDLDRAMADLTRSGTSPDQMLAAQVRSDNARYVAGSKAMFVARDRNASAVEIDAVDVGQVDPVFGSLQDEVGRAARQHHEQALAAVALADSTGLMVVVVDLLTLVLTVCAFAFFAWRMRQVQAALRRQADDHARQALHDVLTGLPNRLLLGDRAGHALQVAQRSGTSVAMLLLDLDRFKEVNDTLGHVAGDQLLVQVGHRLAETCRAVDTVARLGGDEFAILLEDATRESAVAMAERLTVALQETFRIEGVNLDLEASIGIAVSSPGDDVVGLLQRADVAMYQAKETHEPLAVYDPERDVNTPARLALLGDLRRALESSPPDGSGELRLEYQPKISTATGRLYGVEALLRWDHPVRGAVPPASFIPVVETTGLVDELTTSVLRMALTQQRSWLARGFETPVAVNISARSLLDLRFPDRVADLLAAYGVPARLLVVELTETTIMADPDAAVAVLQRLADQGVRLSIDDFGTGYSSMAYLKRLPVSELKIDRSFVMDMHADDNDAVLVQSAVDLGHNLGLAVVAEGVEDSGTLQQLRSMGCDLAQGYHISRPVRPEALESWLDGDRAPDAASAGPPSSAGAPV